MTDVKDASVSEFVPTASRRRASIFPYRGKWRIQYWDSDGKLRTKTAESQKDAYKSLAIIEQLIASNRLPKHHSMIPSLGEWLDTWLASRTSEVRPVTIWGFESTIRNHLKPELGGVPLDAVTSHMVEHLYAVLRSEKSLTEATLLKVHSLLSHAFKRAMRHGVLVVNPMTHVTSPKRKPLAIVALTIDEVTRILGAVRLMDVESQCRWLVALRLGMRQGECLALTFDDIDWKSRTLSITKAVNSLPGKGLVLSAPKSASGTRTLPLDDETYLALHALRQSRVEASASAPLFPGRDGGYREASSDYRAWKKLLSSAGVRQVPLHGARHAAATMLVTAGVDIRSVQLLLGHSSPSFTMATYVHPDVEHLRSAVSQIARLTPNQSIKAHALL